MADSDSKGFPDSEPGAGGLQAPWEHPPLRGGPRGPRCFSSPCTLTLRASITPSPDNTQARNPRRGGISSQDTLSREKISQKPPEEPSHVTLQNPSPAGRMLGGDGSHPGGKDEFGGHCYKRLRENHCCPFPVSTFPLTA